MGTRRAIALTATLAVGLAGTVAGAGPLLAGSGSQARPQAIAAKDARLRFEINATDGDGGVHLLFDADDWRTLTVEDPTGRTIFRTTAEGRMARQGATELFVESAEPPFSELPLPELLKRWPAGTYRLTATTASGQQVVGRARLSHDLPAGPVLVSPLTSDGPQDPDRTVVRWQPVGSANASPIIGYQVLVVQPATGRKAMPKVTLDVTLPPSATSLAVPQGFLLPGTEYEWEVLAIERGGNQTLSSSTFTTTG